MNNGNIFFSVLCAQGKRGQPNDEGGKAVGVPAQMQGSNDCGLAHDDVKPENTMKPFERGRKMKRTARDTLFFVFGFLTAVIGIPVWITLMSIYHLFPCWRCTP